MEGRKKRIRQGMAEFVKDGGVTDVGSRSEGVHQGVGLEGGGGANGSGDGLVGAGSQLFGVHLESGSGLEGEGRELGNLGADFLVEVFKHLPQKDLFEVMLVSRQWEEVVREANELWRTTEVVSQWGMGDEGSGRRAAKKGNEMIRRVVAGAEEVRLRGFVDQIPKHIEWVEGVVGPNLRRIELPGKRVHPALLPRLLTKCPDFESLVVVGNCMGRGSIHIRHGNLKTLKVLYTSDRPFTVECPSLTHLVTRGRDDNSASVTVAKHIPTFKCEQLTNLHLSRLHSTPVMLEAMVVHAPGVRSLDITFNLGMLPSCVTHFGSLRELSLKFCNGFRTDVIDQFPHLESLVLRGTLSFGANVTLCHQQLRALEMTDLLGLCCPKIACPSSVSLRLLGQSVDTKCFEHLHTSCPKLKKLVVSSTKLRTGVENAVVDSMELHHEVLRELALVGEYASVRLSCSNLIRLVMIGEVEGKRHEELLLMQASCPKIRDMIIVGYEDMFRLPTILCALPNLRVMSISNVSMIEGEVVLSHSHMWTLDLNNVVMKNILLDMPEVAAICVTGARVGVLQVTPREAVFLQSTQFRSNGSSSKTLKEIPGGNTLDLSIEGKDRYVFVILSKKSPIDEARRFEKMLSGFKGP